MKIFLIGFMGSGKTHWGKLLAAKLQLPFRDLDTVIVEKENRSVADLFSGKGEEYFRNKEKQTLEEIVEEYPSFILSCGGGTPCFFNNIEFMKKSGKVVWLNTSVDVLKERLLKEKMSRPLIREIGDDDLKRYIIRKLSERRMYYEQAEVIVSEETITLDVLTQLLFRDERFSDAHEENDDF
jgi:shikimate kinase